MINAVSNEAVRGKSIFALQLLVGDFLELLILINVPLQINHRIIGDGYTDGCLGSHGARVWLFVGFLLSFGSLIASAWVLFGPYVANNTEEPALPIRPGVSVFLQV